MTHAERKALATSLFGTAAEPGPIDVGWAKKHLGVGTGTTMQRWRSEGIPADKVGRVLERLAEALPTTEKEPPEPAWVGRLEARLIELRANQDVVARAATQRAVEALGTPEMAEIHRRVLELERARQQRGESRQSVDPDARDAALDTGQ